VGRLISKVRIADSRVVYKCMRVSEERVKEQGYTSADELQGMFPTRAMSPSEKVIRALYEITSDYAAGFPEQVRRLLDVGRERFELEAGALSCVDDEGRCVVKHRVGPMALTSPLGDAVPLRETFCAVAIAAGGPVGFERLGGSAMAGHPMHELAGVESYLATLVTVDGAPWGTLSFASAHVRERRFDSVDIDCLHLMATWLGTEIHRRRTEDALRTATRELKRLTRIDPLTQLLNRRGAEHAIRRMAERAAQDGAPISAVLIDMDDFKAVNDTWSHEVGDRVLLDVANRIRESVRESDRVARIGGDEFLAVLPATDLEQAERVAERVLNAIRSAPVETTEGPVSVRASMGIAPIELDALTVTGILAGVSRKLKVSKQAGKDRISR